MFEVIRRERIKKFGENKNTVFEWRRRKDFFFDLWNVLLGTITNKSQIQRDCVNYR